MAESFRRFSGTKIISIKGDINRILTDGLNKEMCIAAYLFAKQVIYLGRKSGYLHLVARYLKQCNTCLMTAYGGVNRPNGSFSVPVSLTRSGYPRIIPSFHRKMILRKDDRADVLVRLYCSFFSLAVLVKRADKKLFEPIISPVKDMDRVRGRVSQVKCDLVKIMDRYLPWLSTIPLELGLVWLAMTFWA